MYRWIDHTAEVEIAIEAASECEVFADAAAALAELLGFGDVDPDGDARRTVSVSAPDRPTLLAAWLEELVYLAELEGFVALRVEELSLPVEIADNVDNQLTAVVAGIVGDPPPIVKAITYHRLAFATACDGYVATVVLDV